MYAYLSVRFNFERNFSLSILFSLKSSYLYPTLETYHGRDGKVPLMHFFGQPVDLPASVAKNDSLKND